MKGYNTLSSKDKELMLDEIGAKNIRDLFQTVPSELFLEKGLSLPLALSEWELERKMKKLSNANVNVDECLCFLGAGKYNHNVPSVIDAIVNRGEYLTSYTPYQPEMSQGLLQALYEYQMNMSKLSGLEVVNSSSYDGATAMTDAAWVCCAINNKKKILVAGNILAEYQEVLDTYMGNRSVEMVQVSFDKLTGRIDLNDLSAKLATEEVSGFLFQSPNAFGVLEDIEGVASLCKSHDVISSVSINPLIQGIFETPGKQGVDIVTGEGQPLGIHLNAGGSSLGIFAVKKEYRKYVPGRLVGKVTDIQGRLAYALVFEDREQHVAREKATSNICSNQALNAIRAGVYLSYVGEKGLRNISLINASKAEYLLKNLVEIDGVEQCFSGTFFNEFVITLPVRVEDALKRLQKKGVFAGVNYSGIFGLSNALLIAVTEKLSKEDLDYFVFSLKEVI